MGYWIRVLALAALWVILAEGALDSSWWLGLPAVLVAARAPSWLPPGRSRPLLPLQMIPFALFFLHQSFRGGLDVARRVLCAVPDIDPAFRLYRLRLPAGPARILFANIASLLPGTLSADLTDEYLRLHVLDAAGTTSAELEDLECRIARLFGIECVEWREAEWPL